jgi:hypothetical protein
MTLAWQQMLSLKEPPGQVKNEANDHTFLVSSNSIAEIVMNIKNNEIFSQGFGTLTHLFKLLSLLLKTNLKQSNEM